MIDASTPPTSRARPAACEDIPNFCVRNCGKRNIIQVSVTAWPWREMLWG